MALFPVRGVVEGFYGQPWTHAERLDLFGFMRAHGLNAYIYAPKADPLHRLRWREPYGDGEMRAFEELVRQAARNGIDFTLAISPGLSLRYSDEAEIDLLLEKCRRFYAIGVRSFGLFFDDIPAELVHEEDRARYGRLATAQAGFVERVFRRLRATDPLVRLMVCPTIYCGDPHQAYLIELGAELPVEIDLLWTGPAVCSHEITTAHVQAVAQVMRRPPLLWDNYPVNDLQMAGELHIGPYTGRDPDLPAVARGVYANPMNLAEASKIPLATVAAYLREPHAYCPERAWLQAAIEVAGEPLAESLRIFAESSTLSCLAPGDPPGLTALFDSLAACRAGSRGRETLAQVAQMAARMRAAWARLDRAAGDLPALRQMRPWLEEYGAWARLLAEAVAVEQAIHALEEAADPAARRESEQIVVRGRAILQRGLQDAFSFKTSICGNAARKLVQETLRRSDAIETLAA